MYTPQGHHKFLNLCCIVLQCIAVCCNMLHCVAVCCGVLWCLAVCCSVLQCLVVWCSVLQCIAECRSVLQCVAVCCNVLQCVDRGQVFFTEISTYFFSRDAQDSWKNVLPIQYTADLTKCFSKGYFCPRCWLFFPRDAQDPLKRCFVKSVLTDGTLKHTHTQ